MSKYKANTKVKTSKKKASQPLPIDVWAHGLPPGTYCYTDDSNIKFEENKSKIIFKNTSRKVCIKIDVDGGVI